MTTNLKATAFDVDPETLASLKAGLPGWEIEVVRGVTINVLNEGWKPEAADLLIVKAAKNEKETLALCKALSRGRSLLPVGVGAAADSLELQERRRDVARAKQAALLVLVPAGQPAFVRAILNAGAYSCLALPIDPKEVASTLARSHRGNQPGRHTLDLDKAQVEDRWRDDGGQG